MKSIYKWIIGIFLLIVLFGTTLLFLDQTLVHDDFCDQNPGSGKTTINLKVLDAKTNRLIDSVAYCIKYRISFDRLLEDTVKQKNSIVFSFNTVECEFYQGYVGSKWYFEEYFPIEKGVANNLTVLLKPITKVRTRIYKQTKDSVKDTITLSFKRENDKEWETWTSMTNKAFVKGRTFDLLRLEGDEKYKVRVVHQQGKKSDTLIQNIFTKPLQVMKLNFYLKEK